MALLSVEKRKKYFKELGIGSYTEANIKKFQRTAFSRSKDIDGKYGPDTDKALRHWYNVNKFTKNFSPEEFKCECGGRHCTGYPSFMKRVELKNLQKIRSHYNTPMEVTCGLRCKGYNAECKGSITNSLHLSGYATDFYMKGVTDTLANRKKSIKWMKKLENTHYIYGDGINSYGYYVSAPYMGNAMHYDTSAPKKVKKSQGEKSEKQPETTVKPKPVETPKEPTNGDKIAKCANEYAYASNTKKADYDGGAPKSEYKKALDKAYPNRKKWGTAPKKGASCDVFVGTCVRNSGVDKEFPRGLDEQIVYLPKASAFKEVSVNENTVKDGDIIVYAKKGGGAHICIAYKGKIKEAGYKHYYPKTTNYLKTRLAKTGKKWLKVYRAK